MFKELKYSDRSPMGIEWNGKNGLIVINQKKSITIHYECRKSFNDNYHIMKIYLSGKLVYTETTCYIYGMLNAHITNKLVYDKTTKATKWKCDIYERVR